MIPRSSVARCCPVVELRQYTLKPGRRDDLVEVFDRHLVEGQESLGMTVIGQFRDQQRPDRFVWLRGFPDMEARHDALTALYDGPIWAAHKDAANDTMLEWDDVLLLKPVRPDTAFELGADAAPSGPSNVVVGIHSLPRPVEADIVARFEREVAPVLKDHDVRIEGVLVTEPAPNTFTRLPVREGENVLAWFGTVKDSDHPPGWLDGTLPSLDDEPPSILYLEPTSRSKLGNGPRSARASKHDFDFLFGSWTIHNRYLVGRLRNSEEWIEFESTCDAQPLLHGLGNMDRYNYLRNGVAFEGITLRLFDPATGEWSIHWADSAHPGSLLPPMTGRFEDGVGVFFGDESVDGRRVLCRFLWTGGDSPRWEQAFSDDGGESWETNWIMTFTRTTRSEEEA